MGKFEFTNRSRKVILEFPDFTHEVKITKETPKLTENIGNEMMALAEEMTENPKLMIDLVTNYIDDICGSGTTAKIIGDREVDVYDYMSICGYVVSELTAYYKGTSAAVNKILPKK